MKFFIIGLNIWVYSIAFFASAQEEPNVVQVKINATETYQTIEGFGACIIDYTNPPAFFKDPKLYDLAVNDLGMSILRMSFPQELEVVNDDSDPNHFNWPAFNMPMLKRRMDIALEFKKRGVKKFMFSTWSPPEFMKTHHATTQGGALRTDMYDEYAENIAALIISAKQNWGIDIGAFGIQNEMLFIEPYKSCVYLPEQAREAVRALMHKFKREGIHTQILLPEDMMILNRMLAYIGPTMADPETKNFIGGFATHRQEGFETARKWYDATKQYQRQSWMTETSGHSMNWQGAMKMASDMYDYLVGGNMSAWIYWQIAEPNSDYAIMDGAKTSPKYFAAKHFYRYVRPGALRIDGTSSDKDILVSAFKHNEQGTLTMVLINKGDKESNVKIELTGKNLPENFDWYRSTEREQCELKGTQKNGSLLVSLPPQSIVTLIGKSKALQTIKIKPWPDAWKIPASSVNKKLGDFNKTSREAGGWTPLHTAILNGKIDEVKLLLEKGADMNKPANDGWTPLHMAAGTFVGEPYKEKGEPTATKYDVFKQVLAARPNIDVRTKDGQTPLHTAVMNAHTAWRQDERESFNRITDLLKAGANLEAKDKGGRTPLHWAAWQGYGRMTDMLRASDGVVKILLAAKANIDAVDNRGRTPLHYAMEMGYKPIVAALIKAGANTSLKDNEGNTPEDLARGQSLTEEKEYTKADPYDNAKTTNTNKKAKYGPELLKAAWKGELSKVKELLARDADILYRDSDGFRAIDRARDNGHKEIVELLHQAEETIK